MTTIYINIIDNAGKTVQVIVPNAEYSLIPELKQNKVTITIQKD
jgi:hypothetical protein